MITRQVLSFEMQLVPQRVMMASRVLQITRMVEMVRIVQQSSEWQTFRKH